MGGTTKVTSFVPIARQRWCLIGMKEVYLLKNYDGGCLREHRTKCY